MPWFKVVALAEKKAVINIYEQIGKNWWDNSGVDGKAFADTLAALGELDHIELHVNSPGGNVYDGLTIYNLLKRHKAMITGYVDGIAASMASAILMACDKVIMPENTNFFVHDPRGAVDGYVPADEFRRAAADLDRVTDGLVSIYREKTGLPDEEIRALLKAETLMTAAEAVEKGFADEIEAPVQMVATLDVSKLRADAAAQFKDWKPVVDPDPAPAAITVDNVLAFLEADAAARSSIVARLAPPAQAADAEAVIALCEEHHIEPMASKLIKAKLPIDQVQARVDLIRDVADLLDTAGVERGEIMDHLESPIQMMRIAVTNALAKGAASINPNNPRNTNKGAERIPDRKAIYASRAAVSK